jgi:hypothetical protein
MTSEGPGPLRDPDIWRCVHLLLRKYGAEAEAACAWRIAHFHAGGDTTGAAVWRRIREALQEVYRPVRSAGEFLN